MPGRPLLYVAYNAIHLESPQAVSQVKAEEQLQEKLSISAEQKQQLEVQGRRLGVEMVDSGKIEAAPADL